MPLLARPTYHCAKFMTVTAAKLAQAGLSGPYCLPHLRRTPSFGNKIRMSRKMVRNLFPNDQFGNNTFHLQIGRRNKAGLIYQIWEQCVPFEDSNSEQNSPGCLIVKQTVPLTYMTRRKWVCTGSTRFPN